MRIWRMILRRTKSTIISWVGSFNSYRFIVVGSANTPCFLQVCQFSLVARVNLRWNCPLSFKNIPACRIKQMNRDMTNQQSDCAPSEDSNQPGHPPSLIRVFAVRMKKARVLSYPLSAQRRLWSDWVDAQADLSLRWAHSHIVGFVMSRLKYWLVLKCEAHYICKST